MEFAYNSYARRVMLSCLIAVALFFANMATALPPPPPHRNGSVVDAKAKYYFFEQPISHSDPSLGTFRQRYLASGKYYAGPGSPIVLWTPGEGPIEGYESLYNHNDNIVSRFAKATGAGIVIIEHRYYGDSSPYKELTVENLQHLTAKEALYDFARFARTAKLPFDPKGTSQASKAPWLFTGCSYSGALTAWMQSTGIGDGVFWTYHSSSGVVQAQLNYYQYFLPEQKLSIPVKCREDMEFAVQHMDNVFATGTQSAQKQLKAKFGAYDIHNDDFANYLSDTVAWQYGPFPQLCKDIEDGGKKNGDKGAPRLQRVLNGWGKYTKEVGYFHCAGKAHNSSCVSTHNRHSHMYTDIRVNNDFDERQFMWQQCNDPLGFFTTAPPGHGIVPHPLTLEYYLRMCKYYFPEQNGFTYGINRGVTAKQFNAFTGGWTTPATTRIVFNNFEYDPYREVTVAADNRPGGPLKSTKLAPTFIVPKAYHCSDLYLEHTSDALKDRIAGTVAQIKEWTAEYYNRTS